MPLSTSGSFSAYIESSIPQFYTLEICKTVSFLNRGIIHLLRLLLTLLIYPFCLLLQQQYLLLLHGHDCMHIFDRLVRALLELEGSISAVSSPCGTGESTDE